MAKSPPIHDLTEVLRRIVVDLVRNDRPDLTARQFAVFLTCYLEHEAQTVRGLAEKLKVGKPAVTRALDRLTVFDLIQRQADPFDRRSVLTRQTTVGAEFLRELRSIAGKALSARGG